MNLNDRATTIAFPTAAEWDSMEERYRQNFYDGFAEPGRVEERFASGNLIFTAPHALNHPRDGKKKLADRWTGSAAEILAAQCGGGYLITIGEIPDWHEWNDRNDPFKSCLDRRSLPGTLIVDMHGMSDKHGVDLCIGLGPNPSDNTTQFADGLVARLNEFRIAVNDPFSAEPDYTVTSYVQRHTEADAIQLEISARLRNPQTSGEQSIRFLSELAQAIRSCSA